MLGLASVTSYLNEFDLLRVKPKINFIHFPLLFLPWLRLPLLLLPFLLLLILTLLLLHFWIICLIIFLQNLSLPCDPPNLDGFMASNLNTLINVTAILSKVNETYPYNNIQYKHKISQKWRKGKAVTRNYKVNKYN